MVATYNGARTLEQCLRSLLALSGVLEIAPMDLVPALDSVRESEIAS